MKFAYAMFFWWIWSDGTPYVPSVIMTPMKVWYPV